MLFFVPAFALCELLRRRLGGGWLILVPATCLLGSGLFGSIGYMEGVGAVTLDVEPMRVLLFTVWSMPVMASLVAIASGIARLAVWLGSPDIPGASTRSLVER